jgi:carbon monoxide dehydrogenase subunit G
MKVQLDKSYPLPATADAAWGLLQDVAAVAECMPGARITERIDASHFKGTVSVKFGPATMAFRGEFEVKQLDVAERVLRLAGRGTDTTGGSGATLDLEARIEELDAASCRLIGKSEVSVSGKAAAFGGRMMGAVADQVLQQFVANFAARLPAAPVPVASPPREMNGLALLWAMLRNWFRRA